MSLTSAVVCPSSCVWGRGCAFSYDFIVGQRQRCMCAYKKCVALFCFFKIIYHHIMISYSVLYNSIIFWCFYFSYHIASFFASVKPRNKKIKIIFCLYSPKVTLSYAQSIESIHYYTTYYFFINFAHFFVTISYTLFFLKSAYTVSYSFL